MHVYAVLNVSGYREYIALAFADNRQGVVLHLKKWPYEYNTQFIFININVTKKRHFGATAL
jgi:hypothetical protein